MNSKELECQLRRMRWPEPPSGLRARVLAEATVRRVDVVWSDRVWFSRSWRVSIAAATLLLLMVKMWPESHGRAGFTQSPVVMAEVRMIEETVRQAGLPAAVAASLARRAVASRAPVVESHLAADQMFHQEERR